MTLPKPSPDWRLYRFSSLLVAGVFLALAGFAPRYSQAQTPTQITFDEAVRIALEQNVSLMRSANTVELDAINLSRQRSAFLPDLSMNANASQNYGRNFSTEVLDFVDQTTNRMNASASSRVTLFDGFGRVSAYRQAQRNLEASDFDFERQRQTVVFNVMSSYLNLLERREQILIQQENLESQRQQLVQIEEFTNVGSRPISDLYQQQAATANAELTLINAERAYQLGEVGLMQVLQLDPFGAYAFVAPEVTDALLMPQQYEVPVMLQEAFGQRLDLKARENDIIAAREGIRAARSGFFPSLSLAANTSSNYDDQSTFSFSDQFTDIRRSSSIGLNLSIPIFDRFETSNFIQQARVQYDNSRLVLEDLQQNIALDVRQAYLDYVTTEKRLDVTEKQEIAAQQALTAEQERYNVGAATLVELSQARANFVQAASDRTQARFDFLFQKKLIDYYMGRLNPTEPLFQQP
ncbi:MAG: TolC family protein [Rhodothermales bacterium]|nr:TolC family protein [Rhodothermales bacterium]